MFKVCTLGKFCVTSDDCEGVLDDASLRSDMLKKLFVYLLCNRGHIISVQELSEALWDDNETDNPAGALKNLMYRLRTALKKTFGEREYIVTSPGAYSLSKDLEISLDVDEFVNLIKLASERKDKDEKIAALENAIALYEADFMEDCTSRYWVLTASSHYSSLFMGAVRDLTSLYLEEEAYDEAERIINKGLSVDKVNDELWAYLIKAQIGCGKLESARKNLQSAKDILYSALGIRNSEAISEVEEMLLKLGAGTEYADADSIRYEMTEQDAPEGVFICGYPVFKEIYRLESRKLARLGMAEYVMYLTVEVSDGYSAPNEKIESFFIKQGMERLEECLRSMLRIGDVASRYSDCQYIVLLPACTYENVQGVAARIIDRFSSDDKNNKLVIRCDYNEVCEARPKRDR
ncbi:MAG: winged helix-turn-helix domain-containing protein [Lachnospiraceae bacterium]|nr:winged helix-turn-helix domain-containing protein [Lachnospiraceae bacterium]